MRLVWDKRVDGGVRADEGDWTTDYWSVWRVPRENHDYTCGGDVAEGIPSDPSDPTSDPDYSAGTVLDRVERRFVAAHVSRLTGDLFGEQMLMAAIWYNSAWASPEANGVGQAPLMVLKNHPYQRTYQREQPSDYVDVQEAPRLGWKTTPQRRPHMIDDYIAACRPDPLTQWEDRLIVHSDILVGEEETFIYDKTGKRIHRPGCHDHLLFAAMVAWQLHLRCPRTRRVLGRDYRPATNLAYANAIDWGIDEAGEDFEVTG